MLKKWLKEYITINKREILIVVGLLLLGIVIGVGTYIFSSNEMKNMAVTSAKSVLDISKDGTYVKTNIITNGIKTNIITIILLATLSVTLFGKYIIYCLTILKGAAITLYTIVIFNIFGAIWGVVVTLLLVVLVNIIYIPAFIYLVLSFLEVNFNIFRVKLNTKACSTYKLLLGVFVCAVLMFSSVIMEQVCSSIVLNIYNKI